MPRFLWGVRRKKKVVRSHKGTLKTGPGKDDECVNSDTLGEKQCRTAMLPHCPNCRDAWKAIGVKVWPDPRCQKGRGARNPAIAGNGEGAEKHQSQKKDRRCGGSGQKIPLVGRREWDFEPYLRPYWLSPALSFQPYADRVIVVPGPGKNRRAWRPPFTFTFQHQGEGTTGETDWVQRVVTRSRHGWVPIKSHPCGVGLGKRSKGVNYEAREAEAGGGRKQPG